MNRRAFSVILFSLGASWVLTRIPFKSLAGIPYYRRHKPPALIRVYHSPAFYLNRKSGIAHYLRMDRTFAGVRRLNLDNFEIVGLDELAKRISVQKKAIDEYVRGFASPPGPMPRLARSNHVLEQITLEKIKAKNYEEARKFMLSHMGNTDSVFSSEGPRHEVRLYDLLAGLTARYGNNEEYGDFLNEYERLLSDTRNGDETLRKRLMKWQDRKGKWYKKWTDRRKPISWAGLLM